MKLRNLCFAFLSATLVAQAPPQAGEAHSSGAATGGVHAPVKDAQSRPITAGGFIEGAPVIFGDVTQKSGLAGFHHHAGSAEKKYIVEVAGSGVALLDYDNDGWQDIYLLNGSTFAAYKGTEPAPKAALFRNNHDGTFTDVTKKAGLANERWGMGVAVADYDNDGWADIFVSNFGMSRLYHNNHDGTYTDVALKAGVAVNGWFPGPPWGDYDGDGKLDLFVPGYVRFDLDHPPRPRLRRRAEQLLPISRTDGDVRPTRLARRARSPLPQ